MPITVFRSRLNPGIQEDYAKTAKRMAELSKQMPGFVSYKIFHAEDGERVTIVEFSDDESQKIWAKHPEHLEARKNGRELWFETYDVAVCEVIRRYRSSEPR